MECSFRNCTGETHYQMENIKNKYSKGYLNGRINNRIIASVNILPLKEETFKDI